MSYDITTNVGKVRLLIGDTDESDEVFSNTEITHFLTTHSSNINLASAMALKAWAAKYAVAPASEKIGDYSYTQKIVDNMNKLAVELEEKDASTPYLAWAEIDLSGVADTTVSEDIE